MTLDKKQKIEKIHVKEPDQLNGQLSSTTVTDTTIEELRIRYMLLSKKFSAISKQNKHTITTFANSEPADVFARKI